MGARQVGPESVSGNRPKAHPSQPGSNSEMGLEMTMLIKFWGGRQLYVERDRWSTPSGIVEWRADEREILVWIGRWHFIYTPANWSVSAERLYDGRVASRG